MPNTGTLTGLTAATEYVPDAVHVDAWGNVSAFDTKLAVFRKNGQAWVNTGSDANAWEPGVFGWEVV